MQEKQLDYVKLGLKFADINNVPVFITQANAPFHVDIIPFEND